MTSDYDAVVIGAGPAGALSTYLLARTGRRVLLVDKKRFPREKVCGGCLNARATSVLRSVRLGNLVADIDAQPLERLFVHAEQRILTLPLTKSFSVGRSELDQALVEAAQKAGAMFLPETSAKIGALCGNGSTRLVELRGHDATWRVESAAVIAADGLTHSSLPGTTSVADGSMVGVGAVVHGDDTFRPGEVRMIVGDAGYVGMVRLSGDRLNMAAAVRSECLREGPAGAVERLLHAAGFKIPPKLSEASWQGTPPLTRFAVSVADDRLFVLGDATGYVEPFTGEGMTWALESATLLTPILLELLEGRLTPAAAANTWSRSLLQTQQRRQTWCRRVAWVLRTPWRRRTALSVASLIPKLPQWIMHRIGQPVALGSE